MVHGAFHQSFRYRCAILGQNLLFQAAGVHADADGDVLGVAGPGHRAHIFVCTDVAGVDADLIHPRIHTGQRDFVIEMDVGHKRHIHCIFHCFYNAHVLQTGNAGTQNLAAGFHHPLGLSHVARDICYRHIQHGLDCHRIVTANHHIADFYFTFDLTHD